MSQVLLRNGCSHLLLNSTDKKIKTQPRFRKEHKDLFKDTLRVGEPDKIRGSDWGVNQKEFLAALLRDSSFLLTSSTDSQLANQFDLFRRHYSSGQL